MSRNRMVVAGTALIAVNFLGCTIGLDGASLGVIHDDEPWVSTEAQVLQGHVQLTFADRFFKAGEAYFSPDNRRVVFQAVEAVPAGADPEPFYGMYVADVLRDGFGAILGLSNTRRLSPVGSANTCGWFHPTDPNVVIFGSTVGAPTEATPPGFQRQSSTYKWMFPPEMNIVQADLRSADGTADTLSILLERTNGYVAECSFSPDGRHLLYCSLESNEGDLFAKDLETGTVASLITTRGYDGGPFFSPDGKRITYRSDRRGTNELQLMVADLAFNESGSIIGIEREYQVTNNQHVNWAPYWHPNGRYLIYATSQIGHANYEVFMVDADPGDLPGSSGTTRYGTGKKRLTNAEGFDGLPVFDSSGQTMMWTSQRSSDGMSQLWAARFVLPLEEAAPPVVVEEPEEGATINVTDPETGLVYMYDPQVHDVRVYDPKTHEVWDADDAEMERAAELFNDR